MKVKKQDGFTLLEVIVALAITGFILGGLFSLLGSSKQLSWRSEENLLRAARVRAATNFALLQNEFRDVEEILKDDGYEIRSLELLDDPIRKTEPLLYALQRYQITDDSRDEQFFGSRWVRLNLPQ
jgi:prepilin-type N-terminal cleavage/methylation domain-containing protein